MDPTLFEENYPGTVNTDQGYPTYNPEPLPPEIEYSQELIEKLAEARGTVGKLAGIGQMVHESRMLLLGPFIRREAVFSSRIEGTYATVSAVYAHEAGEEDAIEGTTRHEAAEVLNYVRATQHGLERISESEISLELLKTLHGILMTDVRGGQKNPGEFRPDQRAIGSRNPREARFVPTAPHRVPYEMENLIQYIQSGPQFDPLIDISLIHYQFETIHPFTDGNGRMGRLLITLLMDKYGLLPDPFLYLSSYFNQYRDEYVDSLFNVNSKGQWEEWISFFLDGVIDQSKEVFIRSKELLELRDEYREQYQGRRSETLLAIIYEIFRNPVITIKQAEERADVGYQAARNAIYELEEEGILTEVTGKERYKVYHASEIIGVIEKPIEDLVDDVDKEFEKYQSEPSSRGQASIEDFS
ncbi:Fic family protein [Salinigranum sp. GCM10025319]|uniref:Fic family protein n=1 Tax=Salinigranum sp. GCM10025319 TaxID=3252687 RepID=UPI003609431D